MSNMIKDGTGRGYMAGVNSANRIKASCSVSPRIYFESRDRENAFGITTPFLTITTTGGRVLYVKNTSTTKNAVITDIRINWNGGTTNHNLTLFSSIWFDSSAPTANNTTGEAGNLNRSSNNTFDLDVEYWDEVGDGMTIASGSSALNFIIGQGSKYLPISGIILGANDTISFNFKGEEIGEASMQILGFTEDR